MIRLLFALAFALALETCTPPRPRATHSPACPRQCRDCWHPGVGCVVAQCCCVRDL